MPCTVDFAHCEKIRCDANCRSCVYWQPSYSSPVSHCVAPDHIRLMCTQPVSQCAQCLWYVRDRRHTDTAMLRQERWQQWRKQHIEQERERVRAWRQRNRPHLRAYLREWRRKQKQRLAETDAEVE